MVIIASLTKESRSTYTSGLVHFTQFCDEHAIPETCCMPASEQLLAIFIANRSAGFISVETTKIWLQGLQLWHLLNGAPWFGNKLLTCITKGIAALAPNSAFKEKREAITIEHIEALDCALDHSNTFDVAVFTVGELTTTSCNTFDPCYNVAKNTKISHGITVTNVKFCKL
jgi:hypothetical protein